MENNFWLGDESTALAFEQVAMEMRTAGEQLPVHTRFYELVMGAALEGDPSFARMAAQRTLLAIAESQINPAYKAFAMYAMHGLVRSPNLARDLFNPGKGAGAPKKQLGAFLAARRVYAVVTENGAKTVEDAIAIVAEESHKSDSLIAKHWGRFKGDVFALETAVGGADSESKFYAALRSARGQQQIR